MCSRATSWAWIRSEIPHPFSVNQSLAELKLNAELGHCLLTVKQSQHVRRYLDSGSNLHELKQECQ